MSQGLQFKRGAVMICLLPKHTPNNTFFIQIPKHYTCFCSKELNPQNHPWLIPHSCGDTCGKALKPDCGHKCVLLCHPGPCPPCPQVVTTSCMCGTSNPKSMRCAQKTWKCMSKVSSIGRKFGGFSPTFFHFLFSAS